MKKPLLINSHIEFLIAGPIGEKDGLIVQSSNLLIDLVGLAFQIYRKENEIDKSFLYKDSNKRSVGYVWGELPLQPGYRRSRYLFLWKNDLIADDLYRRNIGMIEEEFFKFLENTHLIFNDYYLGKQRSADYYESRSAFVTWNISFLLLKCSMINKPEQWRYL